MSDADEIVDSREGWAMTTLAEIASPSKQKVEPGNCPSSRYLSLEHIESGTGQILDLEQATFS